MGAVISAIKPIVLSLAAHPSVKNLVIELFEKYVKSTDNSIDDTILGLVKENLFKRQA